MSNSNLALLIDAENIRWRLAPSLLERALQFGPCTVRRMYGNFNGPHLQEWQTFGIEHGVTTRHTPIITGVKNSSDFALVIDAMDLLHQGQVGGFCIASSDSDFTGLVIRIREAGLPVHGFGESKASMALRGGYTDFTELVERSEEVLGAKKATKLNPAPDAPPQPMPAPVAATPPTSQATNANPPAEQKQDASDLVLEAIGKLSPDGDWINMSALGVELRLLVPDFKPNRFGSAKLSKLVAAVPQVELDQPASGVVHVRLRRA